MWSWQKFAPTNRFQIEDTYLSRPLSHRTKQIPNSSAPQRFAPACTHHRQCIVTDRFFIALSATPALGRRRPSLTKRAGRWLESSRPSAGSRARILSPEALWAPSAVRGCGSFERKTSRQKWRKYPQSSQKRIRPSPARPNVFLSLLKASKVS